MKRTRSWCALSIVGETWSDHRWIKGCRQWVTESLLQMIHTQRSLRVSVPISIVWWVVGLSFTGLSVFESIDKEPSPHRQISVEEVGCHLPWPQTSWKTIRISYLSILITTYRCNAIIYIRLCSTCDWRSWGVFQRKRRTSAGNKL